MHKGQFSQLNLSRNHSLMLKFLGCFEKNQTLCLEYNVVFTDCREKFMWFRRVELQRQTM